MLAIWSAKGGAGCTVISAGAVLARRAGAPPSLAVDLGGDLALVLLGAPVDGPGIADWLAAGPEVPPDGLTRIERPLPAGDVLLTRGAGPLASQRIEALAAVLGADPRRVVADLGDLSARPVLRPLVEVAQRSLLVTRACPLAVARLVDLPAVPTGVVVVRDRHRRLHREAIEEAAAAPVVAQVEVDPAIGAALDAGLAVRPFPRSFLRTIGAVT